MQFPSSTMPSTNTRWAPPARDAIFIDTTSGPSLSFVPRAEQCVSSHLILCLTFSEPCSYLHESSPSSKCPKYSILHHLERFRTLSYTPSSANVIVTSFKADRCPRCCPFTSSPYPNRPANTAGQSSRPFPRNNIQQRGSRFSSCHCRRRYRHPCPCVGTLKEQCTTSFSHKIPHNGFGER